MKANLTSVPMPDEPVDRFELRWWTIDEGKLIRNRAVYHVNTPWGEACPDGADFFGDRADFVDHWQLFHDGRYAGRTADGWLAVHGKVGADMSESEGVYWHEREARQAYVEHLRESMAEQAEGMADTRRALEIARRELDACIAYEARKR